MATMLAAGKITKHAGRSLYTVYTERYPEGTMTFDIHTMTMLDKIEERRVAICADSVA